MYKYPKGCCFSTLADIAKKRVTVMGLGLNGGGVESAKWLLSQGAIVTVTDQKSAGSLQNSIDALRDFIKEADLDIDSLIFHLGGHITEDFTRADCVIKNPIVNAESNEYIQAAFKSAVPVETDLSLFLHFTKSPIIAVTGTKGKSTTVCALKAAFDALGEKAFLGGNVTISPLGFLDKTTLTTPVILELSSWQLRDLCGRGALHPKVAVITKIASDHQNWYHSMENYVADKALIYSSMGPGDTILLDSDEWGDKFSKACFNQGVRVIRYNCKACAKEIESAISTDNFSNNGSGDNSSTTSKDGNTDALGVTSPEASTDSTDSSDKITNKISNNGIDSKSDNNSAIKLGDTISTASKASPDSITSKANDNSKASLDSVSGNRDTTSPTSKASNNSTNSLDGINGSALAICYTTDSAKSGDEGFLGFMGGEVILRDLKVIGLHTKVNALNAAAVLRIWGFGAGAVIKAFSKWRGVPHRLQLFHKQKTPFGAVSFYNDSAATIPEAAEASVASFPRNLVLITGGTDKGLDFTPLARAILRGFGRGSLKSVYFLSGSGTDKLFTHFERMKLTGREGPAESKLLAQLDLSKKQVYTSLDTLLEALKSFLNNFKCTSGDVTVLFSPGCTSFGMFSNEFDRGNKFMDKVKAIFFDDLKSQKYSRTKGGGNEA